MVYSDTYGNVLWTEYMYSYCIPDGSLTQPTFSEEPTGGGAEYQYTTVDRGDCSAEGTIAAFSTFTPTNPPIYLCTTEIIGKTYALGGGQWDARILFQSSGQCNSLTGMYELISDVESPTAFPSSTWENYVRSQFDGEVRYRSYLYGNYGWGIEADTQSFSVERMDYFGYRDCWL